MLKVKLLTNTLEVCFLLSKADHIKSTVFGILLPESVKLLLKWINSKTTLYNLIKATEFSSQRNKLNARQVEIYSCTSGTFTLTTCSFLMCLQNCKQNFFTIDWITSLKSKMKNKENLISHQKINRDILVLEGALNKLPISLKMMNKIILKIFPKLNKMYHLLKEFHFKVQTLMKRWEIPQIMFLKFKLIALLTAKKSFRIFDHLLYGQWEKEIFI